MRHFHAIARCVTATVACMWLASEAAERDDSCPRLTVSHRSFRTFR